MISRSISNDYTFSKFEPYNTVRLGRANSNDDTCSHSDMDSRSNSIIDEDNYTENQHTVSEQIPIPSPYNARKREVNYDGKNILDQRCLTPTPTKYYLQIQENVKKILKLFANQ